MDGKYKILRLLTADIVDPSIIPFVLNSPSLTYETKSDSVLFFTIDANTVGLGVGPFGFATESVCTGSLGVGPFTFHTGKSCK